MAGGLPVVQFPPYERSYGAPMSRPSRRSSKRRRVVMRGHDNQYASGMAGSSGRPCGVQAGRRRNEGGNARQAPSRRTTRAIRHCHHCRRVQGMADHGGSRRSDPRTPRPLERLGDLPLAVRSSALAEDLASASFAGQYETAKSIDALSSQLRSEFIDRFRRSGEFEVPAVESS